MDLEGCKQIAEIVTTSSGPKLVNEYLELGWSLIAVGTMTTDAREYSAPMTKYSLGWFSEELALHPTPPYVRDAI